jgi:aromatic ring-opening dioxygenase LigB subunit
MPIVGAFIAPHGALILDPMRPNVPKDSCSKLHSAMMRVAQEVEDLKPQIVFLATPHGICLSGSFGIYLNNRARGPAEWDGMWSEFAASVELNTERSKELISALQKHSLPVEGIISFSSSVEAPMRWGEVLEPHSELISHQRLSPSGFYRKRAPLKTRNTW